jgi:uncharacterized protein
MSPQEAVQMVPTTPVEVLTHDTCWSLLRTTTVGRLAVLVEDHPDLFPINFGVDHGTVVFRSGEGTKLFAALSTARVAFEADGFDPDTGRAWSVVVKGAARPISEIDELTDTVDLPIFPWQAGDKGHFVRITPSEVTGRRFTVADPDVWRTPATRAPRSATE